MGKRFAVVTSLVVLMGLALASAAANAASIVYIKNGDVWLAAPDGSNQRQVTTGGLWSFPSQAADGTIMATQGTDLYRLDRQGDLLVPPIGTVFDNAPAGWAGPVDDVISPDGVNQAYSGLILTSPINCFPGPCTQTNQFITRWGSATTTSEPNETLGQGDYQTPAWIDDSHLLITSTALGIQVATYTIGRGNNSGVGWFSDNNVASLNYPAITPAGDKLAFIATDTSLNGTPDNEIRLYQTNGPPPENVGDPVYLPTLVCSLPLTGFQSFRVSFSPDGQSLIFGAPDGVHEISLAGWPDPSNCPAMAQSDKLIIPGGGSALFGPADVGPNDGCGACAGGGPGGTTGSSGPGAGTGTSPGAEFSIRHRKVSGGVITLTLSGKLAGAYVAHATFSVPPALRRKLHGRKPRGPFGSASARSHRAGILKLKIAPLPGASRTLARAGRMLVSITIHFKPKRGKATTLSLVVVVSHVRR